MQFTEKGPLGVMSLLLSNWSVGSLLRNWCDVITAPENIKQSYAQGHT